MKIPALVATAAMVLAGCVPAPEQVDERPIWARGPVVEAQGRAYVEMAPNRANFTVKFESKAERSEEASAAVVEQANRAAEAIRLASEDAVRITSNLAVRPYYKQVTRRTGEHSEQLVENVHPDALLGYVATVTVNVTLLDPAQAAVGRGAALAAGPVDSSPMSFYLEPTTESQRAVFAQAVQDATERARLIAEASGSKLGALLLLQEGAGPCLGTHSTPIGYVQDVRQDALMARAAAAPESNAQIRAAAAEQFALAADLQPQRVEARACAVYALE